MHRTLEKKNVTENKLNKIDSTESYLSPTERIQQSQVLTVLSCSFICLDRQECQLFRRELFCTVLRYHVQSCLNRASPQTRHFKQTDQLDHRRFTNNEEGCCHQQNLKAEASWHHISTPKKWMEMFPSKPWDLRIYCHGGCLAKASKVCAAMWHMICSACGDKC